MRSIIATTIAFLLAFVHSGPIYLSALEGKTGSPAVLVFLQGAQIANERYQALALEIQKAATFPLKVILPEFLLDLAIPASIVIHGNIQDALKKAPEDFKNIPIFLGGHSIGAAATQREITDYPQDYKGAVIFGASIERRFNSMFPLPFVAINAELDGLQRISRVTESIFNHFDRKKRVITAETVKETAYYTVVGMNHMQMADGVNPPSKVKELDLKAQISTEEAHKLSASAVAAFLCANVAECSTKEASLKELVEKTQATRDFLEPLVKSFISEGSPNFFKPCDSDTPSPHCPFYPAYPPVGERTPSADTSCLCGVPFAATAARIMAGLEERSFPFYSVDAIHDVNDRDPYHRPHVWSNCSLADATPVRPCFMNSTTVSTVFYPDDKMDVGLEPATANEIVIKMASRQVYALNSIDLKATLEKYDSGSTCARINQASYDYAKTLASPSALARFERFGQPLVMVEDGSPALGIGPLFVNSKLEMKDATVNQKLVRQVKAFSFKTDYVLKGLDAVIAPPYSNGFHYCKVLSPARALEWILVDGIRKNMGITK